MVGLIPVVPVTGYVLLVKWLYPEVQLTSPLWLAGTTISVLLWSSVLLLVCYWHSGTEFVFANGAIAHFYGRGIRGIPWTYHPVAVKLQLCADYLGLSSWKEVAEKVHQEYRELDKFSSTLMSFSSRTVVTSSFIIRIGPYSVRTCI